MLLEVASETLKHAGWPVEVRTGRLMFDLGENERHSAQCRTPRA